MENDLAVSWKAHLKLPTHPHNSAPGNLPKRNGDTRLQEDLYTQVHSSTVFLSYLFLIGGQLLYSIVLASAMHQPEPATGAHMSLPSGSSLPPPAPPGHDRASALSSLCRTAKFRWLSHSPHGNAFVSVLFSQFFPPPSSPTVSTSPFSVSASSLCSSTICKSQRMDPTQRPVNGWNRILFSREKNDMLTQFTTWMDLEDTK